MEADEHGDMRYVVFVQLRQKHAKSSTRCWTFRHFTHDFQNPGMTREPDIPKRVTSLLDRTLMGHAGGR